jgi:hypothetical protein
MGEQNEQRYFDMLKRITLYQSVEHLRRHSERDWGLPFNEALGMAYENVIEDARRAIRGKRRPQTKPKPKRSSEFSSVLRPSPDGAFVHSSPSSGIQEQESLSNKDAAGGTSE